jgi:hypothetical protein
LTVVTDLTADEVVAAGLVVEAGTCAITGAVSMEAAMSAMATLRNMGIAFRGNGPPAANRLSGGTVRLRRTG